MDHPQDDVLILTEDDLITHTKNTCSGKTKKGNNCRNKSFGDHQYCKLHYKQYSLEKPEDCPICMEKIEGVNFPLKCGHWFHTDCLMKCKADTCPVCRAEIKFTENEKRKRRRIHSKKNSESDYASERFGDIILPQPIVDLIESLLRGVPEYMREEFVTGFLNIDIGENSIILGNSDESIQEEFSMSDIEDFPDIVEFGE